MASLKYPPTRNGVQKTLDAQLDSGVTASLTLNNVTGIQNKAGVVVINRIDTNGAEKDPSLREYIIYTGTSGNTLTGLTRNADSSTSDQDHAVGSVVEFIPDVLWGQAIIDALANLVDTSTGAVDTTKVVTPAGTQTLTNKTISGGSNTISGITETMLSTSDITTLNVSTTKHGFVPKAPNDTTKFLRGDGTWEAPTSSTAPSFHVHRNGTNQNPINDNTYTKVQFTTEVFDSNSNFDNATNYRFTPTVAGKYLIALTIAVDTTVTDKQHAAAIYKNGTIYAEDVKYTNTTGTQGVSVSAIVDMNGSTDYIEGYYYQNTGGAVQIKGAATDTFMSGSKIG